MNRINWIIQHIKNHADHFIIHNNNVHDICCSMTVGHIRDGVLIIEGQRVEVDMSRIESYE